MAFMEWKGEYNVNVAEIDEQHRQLVNLINELHEAAQRNHGRNTVGAAIDELETIEFAIDTLVDYVSDHFATEEQQMIRRGYPGYVEHKEAHQAAINRVNGFKAEWHCRGFDRALGRFLLE